MKASWVGIAALLLAGQACADDVEAGKLAFGTSICKGCHAIETTGYGPSMRDVGHKYATVEGAKEILIKKVNRGSRGQWGEEAAMPSQKGNISNENLSAILDYVLSFK